MKKFFTPRMMMILSMAAFGTLGIFVRHIPLTSGQLALCRAVMASVFLGLILLITRQKIPFRSLGRDLPLLLFSGAAMGFNWILLFEAYRYTTVSAATLSYYFAPVIVTVASPILFREKMRLRQWICFVMSTLGIVLITGTGDLSAGGSHLTGILFGLGAACLYATVILLNKFIRGVKELHRTLLQFIAAAAVLAPYVLLTDGLSLGGMNSPGWICLLIVGLVHTGIVYCLYFASLRELPGQKAAILSYIDPLVAVILSVCLLGEDLTAAQIVGGLLILGFTLYNELASAKDGDR